MPIWTPTETPADVVDEAANTGSAANLEIVLQELYRLAHAHAESRAEVAATNMPATIDRVWAAGHTEPGDGGAQLIKRVGSEPIHPGKVQSTDGAWWELVPHLPGRGVTIEQFGNSAGFGAGSAARDAINDAINFSDLDQGAPVSRPARAQVFVNSSEITLDAAVVVPWRLTFDLQGCIVKPATDVPLFSVERRGILRNIVCDCSGVGGYASDVVTLNPAGTNWNGALFDDFPVIEKLRVVFPTSSQTGRAVVFDATANWIQFVPLKDIAVAYGAAGIAFAGTSTTNYVNGCRVSGARFFECVDAMTFNFAKGNRISDVIREAGTSPLLSRYTFTNESTGNTIDQIGWDGATHSFDAGSTNNRINGADQTQFLAGTDSGAWNEVEFAGGLKVDVASRAKGWDPRHGWANTPGMIEWKEDFRGGLGPRWRQTFAGGGTTSFGCVFQGAAGKQALVRRATIHPNGNGAMTLDTQQDFLSIRNKPVMHLIWNPNSSATSVTRVGLMASTAGNWGVYFEVDSTTHGNANMKFVVANNSIRTVTDIPELANSDNNLWYATVRMTATSVEARVARYVVTASTQLGQVDDGIQALYDATHLAHEGIFTVTTNIPVDETLKPICHVTDTGSGKLQMMMFHVIAGTKGSPP